MIQSLFRSQKIAASAYQCVKKRNNSQKETTKKYGALVHKLPAMILQNGLTQATGFLLSRSDDEAKYVLQDLATVLKTLSDQDWGESMSGFHEHLLTLDLYQHMAMTRQALEVSGWMRRYVQGILKISSTGTHIDEASQQEGHHD